MLFLSTIPSILFKAVWLPQGWSTARQEEKTVQFLFRRDASLTARFSHGKLDVTTSQQEVVDNII